MEESDPEMPRPLNFLHVTTFYPPYSFGGDGIFVQRLAHALGDQGHHVDIVHCVDSYLLAGRRAGSQSPVHPNVTVHPLRSPYGWLSPLLSHQTGRPYLKQGLLQAVLDGRNHDVVHFHNISLLGPEVLALGNPEAIKLYTMHEYWLVCPTHLLWKFGRELCQAAQCLRCTIRAKRPPQLWRYTGLLDEAAQRVDQFLSPSQFTARLHAERGFNRPVRYLPNFSECADQDWLQPPPSPYERPYFLYAGRLETIKGLQTLIPLWEKITAFDLLVAGSGSQESALRAMAAGNARVRFAGNIPQQEMGRFYVHAVALIVPSLTYEIFPLVVAEALARKTPVIAREIGGLTELIGESGGGFVYRSEEELLQTIHRLGSCAPLRSEAGERGYRHFLEHWSTAAHLKLYSEILSETAQRKLGRIPWEAV